MSRSPQAEPSAPTALSPATFCPLFTFAALLVVAIPVSADELRLDRVEHITVEDGLAHSTVWDVEQDHLGFLWIATVNGLQRYDGYELETYKHDPDDPDSLSATRVRTIFEDRQGVLWLPTLGGGLNRFDRAQERFVRFRHDPDDPTSLADDNLRTAYEDSSGTLWTGGAGALHRRGAPGGHTRSTAWPWRRLFWATSVPTRRSSGASARTPSRRGRSTHGCARPSARWACWSPRGPPSSRSGNGCW